MTVPSYCIYMVADDRIEGVPATVEYGSDADVTEFVKQFLDGMDIEVLDGARVVVRLKSTDPK
jgi:hypothetical protein